MGLWDRSDVMSARRLWNQEFLRYPRYTRMERLLEAVNYIMTCLRPGAVNGSMIQTAGSYSQSRHRGLRTTSDFAITNKVLE